MPTSFSVSQSSKTPSWRNESVTESVVENSSWPVCFGDSPNWSSRLAGADIRINGLQMSRVMGWEILSRT